MTELQDVRLYGRAINGRWPIDADKKKEIVDELIKRATTSEKDSVRVAACKVLVAAEGQNQKDEHSNLSDLREKILAIASQFGIELADVGIGEVATGSAESSPGAVGIAEENGTG